MQSLSGDIKKEAMQIIETTVSEYMDEQVLCSERFEHRSFHDERLQQEHNRRERAFAKQWNNRPPHVAYILRSLLCGSPDFASPLLAPSEPNYGLTQRDTRVAATVIQWLGSNVGMSFLNEVFRSDPEAFQSWASSWATLKKR